MGRGMRSFSYKDMGALLLTPEIVELLSALSECKGKQETLQDFEPEKLETMVEIAKVQSIGASNRIEGIFTSDKRLRELAAKKIEPRNRNEAEIAGYREVLSIIHNNYEYINISPNVILQLHRDLYSFHPTTEGGQWKNCDNFITEMKDGEHIVRFTPVSAFQTDAAIANLCISFNESWRQASSTRILLIFAFILDFLCIHPFNDGNGRISRLLTLLLLYKSGYSVGKYMSIERLIEESKESYYETLRRSSHQWHDNTNSYSMFVHYSLSVLIKAYQEFLSRAAVIINKKSKFERIKGMFDQTMVKLSKMDIADKNPDIGLSTIETALSTLLKEGYITKIGKGSATSYAKKYPDNKPLT
ncbi:MAG: Fic family protein [Holosporales bacterium]|jgi:Fic family protein|nr:Fic family protein [Holosporales bacterium]